MPLPKTYSEQKVLKYTPSQVYKVVADIKSYPEFVPWCVGTQLVERLLSDSDREFIDEAKYSGERSVAFWTMSVGFQALHDSYVSDVHLVTDRLIKAMAIDARLFDHLISEWMFSAIEGDPTSCLVGFKIDFEFKSYLYAFVANMFFTEVVMKMMKAFENRCEHIYFSS